MWSWERLEIKTQPEKLQTRNIELWVPDTQGKLDFFAETLKHGVKDIGIVWGQKLAPIHRPGSKDVKVRMEPPFFLRGWTAPRQFEITHTHELIYQEMDEKLMQKTDEISEKMI